MVDDPQHVPRMLTEQDLTRIDLEDQAQEVGYLTPREYAKLRGMSPQLVYYYIRTKVIEDEVCKCGRRIVSVHQADEALSKKHQTGRTNLARTVDAQSEVRTVDQEQGPTVS